MKGNRLTYCPSYFLSLLENLTKFICLLLDLCLSDAGAAAPSSGSATDSDTRSGYGFLLAFGIGTWTWA